MMRFPISMDERPAHPAALPGAVDVAVVGGGIVGVMTAYYLARGGASVALAEKGRIAGEQSSRNWGWIRQQGRDRAELPIMVEANRLWRGLEAETGEDLGLRQTGIAYLAADAAEMARHEAFLRLAREHGVNSQLLSSREVAALLPKAARSWAGALWTASDLRAEPWQAVPALARAAARAGVRIREGCAVRALDMEAGRVAGIVTEHGRVRAGAVVLAGGAWSSLFLRNHGVELPQLSVRSTVAATVPLSEVHDGAAVDARLAWRRRLDGGYTLAPAGFHEFYIGPDAFRRFAAFWPQLRADPFGTRFLPAAPRGYPDAWGTARRWGEGASPFEGVRVLNPAPNAARVRRLARDFEATFPALGPVGIRAAWAGMIDTMPDVVPVIDRVPGLPGLVVATGMSGHGFGIGPGIGRVVADLVAGRAPGHDLTRFRFGRFTDGSKLEIGPAV
jgi:glycine/D-amino acid oxidase-like deaminating enzyme